MPSQLASMLAAVDTGFFEALSRESGQTGRRRGMARLTAASEKLHLVCAIPVLHEAASHAAAYLERLGSDRWREDQTRRFFEDFFSAVEPRRLSPRGALDA